MQLNYPFFEMNTLLLLLLLLLAVVVEFCCCCCWIRRQIEKLSEALLQQVVFTTGEWI